MRCTAGRLLRLVPVADACACQQQQQPRSQLRVPARCSDEPRTPACLCSCARIFSARFQLDVRCWSQSTLLLQHLLQLSRRARRRASAFSLHLGPLGVDGDRPLNFESRLTNARPPSQLAHLATGGTSAIVRAVCMLTRGCWISAEQSIAWAAPRTSHGSLASCIQPGWQRFERSIFATVAAAAK